MHSIGPGNAPIDFGRRFAMGPTKTRNMTIAKTRFTSSHVAAVSN